MLSLPGIVPLQPGIFHGGFSRGGRSEHEGKKQACEMHLQLIGDRTRYGAIPREKERRREAGAPVEEGGQSLYKYTIRSYLVSYRGIAACGRGGGVLNDFLPFSLVRISLFQ